MYADIDHKNRVRTHIWDEMLQTLTIAASFHLAHPVEGIRDQVGESPIQVYRGQAALVPVPGRNQLGQIAVQSLRHATDVQLPCRTQTQEATMRTLFGDIKSFQIVSFFCEDFVSYCQYMKMTYINRLGLNTTACHYIENIKILHTNKHVY